MSNTNKLIAVMPGRRLGTLIDASVAMTAHGPLSSAMCRNDDIDWPVHFLMLSFHDLRRLPLRPPPSTVPCDGRRQGIMTTDMAEP